MWESPSAFLIRNKFMQLPLSFYEIPLTLEILQAAALEGQETSVVTDYILKVPP